MLLTEQPGKGPVSHGFRVIVEGCGVFRARVSSDLLNPEIKILGHPETFLPGPGEGRDQAVPGLFLLSAEASLGNNGNTNSYCLKMGLYIMPALHMCRLMQSQPYVTSLVPKLRPWCSDLQRSDHLAKVAGPALGGLYQKAGSSCLVTEVATKSGLVGNRR